MRLNVAAERCGFDGRIEATNHRHYHPCEARYMKESTFIYHVDVQNVQYVNPAVGALTVTTGRPLAALPGITWVVHEWIDDHGHRITAWRHEWTQVVVQIGPAGRAEVIDVDGHRREMPPGTGREGADRGADSSSS